MEKKPTWCTKCGVRVGMSSSEYGSVTFKGNVSGIKMNYEFKLCGRCVKKLGAQIKDRNMNQRKPSGEKVIILSRETNAQKKVEKQVEA